jgi:NAD(P)H-hydrate epimerase
MRTLEINAQYFGITLNQLMENAGASIAKEITEHVSKDKKIAIFCGLGGNGGDGFVAARHLLTQGYSVQVFLAGKSRDINHQAAKENYTILQNLNGTVPICEISDSSMIPKVDADTLVDALLGTGSKGVLKAPIAQIVHQINSLKHYTIAIDAPTGINADTGEVMGEGVKADLTITFHKAKAGLEKAKKYVGQLVVADIGLPKELEEFAGPGDVDAVVRQRDLSAHKGDFGKLLVVGGSEVFSGAPALVALAAMRVGVDIVYVAAPERAAVAISSMSPDLITVKLKGANLNPDNIAELKPYLESVDAVAIGPGLGLADETKKFVKAFIEEVEAVGKPLLLDADGLKAFATFKRGLKVPAVLTPHAGEYAILTGEPLPHSGSEKIDAIQKAAKKLKAVILVKGKVDIIGSSDQAKLNFTGNPGMTVGGTGDVLSGVVAGLLAQKTDPFEAAVAAAFVNGAAGDFVAEQMGYHMVATDLVEWIPAVLEDPMSHLKVKASGK